MMTCMNELNLRYKLMPSPNPWTGNQLADEIARIGILVLYSILAVTPEYFKKRKIHVALRQNLYKV